MLEDAYLLAKIGADTAENERKFAENLPKFGNYPTGPSSNRRRRPGPDRRGDGELGHTGGRDDPADGTPRARSGPFFDNF